MTIFFTSIPLLSQGLIIDHNCTDISKIPNFWVDQVKSLIKLHYAHTSHGGQLTAGIERLANPSLPVYDPRLTYKLQKNSLPDSSDLCIMDGQLNHYYVTIYLYWKDGGDFYTRETLNVYLALNVSMFSWCCELNHYSEAETNSYLTTISELEKAYPYVTFVYMTGNAQAIDFAGHNRYLRNEQIRKYCKENNKILFDFADLDSWYGDEQSTYSYNDIEIPKEHPHYDGDECMHTTYSSCENKGKALWWLLAKIAGWDLIDCDYNNDSIVDKRDLIDKRKDVFQEYDNWVKGCWEPMNDCADFNGDGLINSIDMIEKQKSLYQKIIIWMKNCGFQKKGKMKR